MSFNYIPDDWSAEQALAIYEFLGDLQQQIWVRYERQLVDLMCSDVNKMDANQPDLFELNDPIPF